MNEGEVALNEACLIYLDGKVMPDEERARPNEGKAISNEEKVSLSNVNQACLKQE